MKIFSKNIIRYVVYGFYVLVFFVIIGEVYFRLPWTIGMLSYEFDSDLAFRLKPAQKGISIIGNGTFTPVITLNSEGYRGKENNSKKAILCLGSSEVLGTGVKDDETWVSILEQKLRAKGVDIQTINAGNPGYGPYHFKVTLERYLLKHPDPEAVIIRVNTGDMDFSQPSLSKLEKLKVKSSRNAKLKKISIFVPFFINKIEQQKNSILRIFKFNKNKNMVGLNQYESSQAADTMINRFKSDFESIICICEKKNIPLIFCVIDPISSPSNICVVDKLKKISLLAGYGKLYVYPILSHEYNLEKFDFAERKKIVIETLRLSGDPHSNSLQHAIIGEKISEFYLSHIRR